MSKAWFFGCSMTKGVSLGAKANYWPKQVSAHLGCEHINLAQGGGSNEVTLNTFSQNILKFKPEDIVVVGVTCIRLTFPYRDRGRVVFTGHPRYINIKSREVDIDTRIKIIDTVEQAVLPFNEEHVRWYVNSFSNLQDYLANNNIRMVVWDTSHWSKHEVISEADHHWSQKGHNSFAKFIITSVENYDYKLFSKNLL